MLWPGSQHIYIMHMIPLIVQYRCNMPFMSLPGLYSTVYFNTYLLSTVFKVCQPIKYSWAFLTKCVTLLSCWAALHLMQTLYKFCQWYFEDELFVGEQLTVKTTKLHPCMHMYGIMYAIQKPFRTSHKYTYSTLFGRKGKELRVTEKTLCIVSMW